MVEKLNTLTSAQIARMPEWVEKWTAIGLSTAPVDFECATRAAVECYRVAAVQPPRIVVLSHSPLGAIWAGMVMAATHRSDRTIQKSAPNLNRILNGDWAGVEVAYNATEGGLTLDRAVLREVDYLFHAEVDRLPSSDAYSDARRVVAHSIKNRIRKSVAESVVQCGGSGVCDSMSSGIEDSVDGAIHKKTQKSAGNSVTFSVWNSVLTPIEDHIDEAVRTSVLEGVRWPVRTSVRAVSNRIESGLPSVGRVIPQGGQLWADWCSFVSFFRDVCGWKHECLTAFHHDEALALSCGGTWSHRDIIAISDRPCLLRRDNAGQLHSADSPAIEYRDGWGICVWHGFRLPVTHEWIVREREKLSADKIDAETNAELRRIMLENFGYERYLGERGAKEIAVDTCDGRPRRLLDLTVQGETIRVVEVENGSLEPDGTRRKFVLGAARHPITNALPGTPHEAIAWSYGRPADQYEESVRT